MAVPQHARDETAFVFPLLVEEPICWNDLGLDEEVEDADDKGVFTFVAIFLGVLDVVLEARYTEIVLVALHVAVYELIEGSREILDTIFFYFFRQ